MNVSWRDANAFCAWASEVAGRRIRLPSEAEWEKAARGTDGRTWPWGDQFPTDDLCNFAYNSGGTTPVDKYGAGASVYGVMDIAGNVWEWTTTLWGEDRSNPRYEYPYDASDGRERVDAPDRVRRVLRGGSYLDRAEGVRCAYRYWDVPDFWFDLVGFRVVASPSTSEL